MKIRFIWFWQSFDENDNFFTQLLQASGVEVEIVRNKDEYCDLEIVSVYGPVKRKIHEKIHSLRKRLPVGFADTTVSYPLEYEPDSKNFERRVWYTSENVRPPYLGRFDGFLSYDQDDYFGKNVYLPLWYMHAGFFKRGRDPRSGASPRIDELTKPRDLNNVKEKFACAFVGNAQPTRMHAIQALKKFSQVDLFGPAFGNKVTDKMSISHEYKYMLCFENDLFPGYVTEKLIDAYLCGTIPIYWGDLGFDLDIERESFYNLTSTKKMSVALNNLLSIEDKEYKGLYEKPFLKSIPNLDGIRKQLLG